MATVPKPVAVTAPPPAQAARVVGPSSRVAAVSTSQVDQPDVSTNIAFDAATSGYLQEQKSQSTLNKEGGSQQRFADPGFDRLFTANTQVFAEIFEADSKAAASNSAGVPARSNKTPVSSIIKTYENNALVISGRQHYNGTEFSFNL